MTHEYEYKYIYIIYMCTYIWIYVYTYAPGVSRSQSNLERHNPVEKSADQFGSSYLNISKNIARKHHLFG